METSESVPVMVRDSDRAISKEEYGLLLRASGVSDRRSPATGETPTFKLAHTNIKVKQNIDVFNIKLVI